MSAKGDHKKLLRKLRKQGCSVRADGRRHVKVTLPSGELVVMPSTPGDCRGMKNARALLRRKGAKT